MRKQISIDPVTRLEGHGKISLFLDDEGHVERAYLQVPDFRGFEKFCEGRAAEEMPALTQKICGVCPTAHHTASTKALDDLFKVEPPGAAKKIRELMYNAFVFEDHLLHFYFLGGPDFIVGLDAPKEKRNIFGVRDALGVDVVKKVIQIRKQARELNAMISGSPLYPVCGLPGGISKALTEEDRIRMKELITDFVPFAECTLKIFDDVFIKNKEHFNLMVSDAYCHRTSYVGLVDEENEMNFYDGRIRIVDPDGKEVVKFAAKDYLKYLQERVEPWSFMKTVYLRNIGRKGFAEGLESGIFRVGPLARLNASEGMATPLAHAEYKKMFSTLGGKPVHYTLAYHWARVIEILYAAERMNELVNDPQLSSPVIRHIPGGIKSQGIAVCEAPRGLLLHHYQTDKKGILQKVNLLVATQNNAAALNMSVEKAAKAIVKSEDVSDSLLNMIEIAFRAYDPCFACATHFIRSSKLIL
jgi:F420-non-reducing hydrogenase large subunit